MIKNSNSYKKYSLRERRRKLAQLTLAQATQQIEALLSLWPDFVRKEKRLQPVAYTQLICKRVP